MKKEVTKFQENGILDFELRPCTSPTPQLRGSCGGYVPGLASWGQRGNTNFVLRELWLYVLTCILTPWGVNSGSYLCFLLLGTFPGLKWPPGHFVESTERQVYQPQPPGARDNG